jgi:serine/threonine protein kinase
MFCDMTLPKGTLETGQQVELWQEGEVINTRWKILKNFTHCGTSAVSLVQMMPRGRILVAKTFRREKAQAQASEVAEFKKEVLFWMSLGVHPYIAAVYGNDIGGVPVILTRYYRGGDLAGAIGSGRLSQNLALTLQLALDFCEGMIHAHSLGLIAHRDIKPRNCLLDDDDHLVVTDFGLGKTSDTERGRAIRNHGGEASDIWFQTRTGDVKGTLAYMAPEPFRDLRLADTRSDFSVASSPSCASPHT